MEDKGFADFILVGQKLQNIGFIYYRDKVIVVNPEILMS